MRLLIAFFCFISVSVFAQTYTIKGKVKNASTGDNLPFATVKVASITLGTTTDFDGSYSLKMPQGTYLFKVQCFGYQTQEIELTVNQDLKYDFKLQEVVNQLDEVVIEMEAADANVAKVEMSVEKLEMEEIKKMPAFLGEVDVIRSIQLLPGVSTVGEGATGFNVRGGNVDQNLILLDRAPIYSSSHLFGFFSIFNSDALENLTLYKGAIPAQYGGRLSSVLEINQAEGNSDRVSLKGGLGLVSSRLTVGGPIKKKESKGTWQVSGRRSYADVFVRLSPDSTINNNVAYFYDLNGKGTYRLNENNKIALSGYYGRDVFKFGDDFGFDWGNATASAQWDHTFSDSLFSTTSLIYSNYAYSLGVPSGEFEFDWNAKVENVNLHSDYEWIYSSASTFKWGIQLNSYFINPGVATPGPLNTTFNGLALPKERAYEPNLYASHSLKLSKRVSMEYGLRYSSFYKMGEEETYVYKEGQPKFDTTVVDTINFKSGEVVKSFHALEPRLGIKIGLDSTSSIKLSYNRTKQYIHLISNTTGAVPFDLWRPSGYHINPATADQFALGYFRNFEDNMYETSAEVYFKWMQDLVDYKNGAELLFNETLEADLLAGVGRAYGLELMVRKKKGDFTGWFSYTLSKTERRVSGNTPEERINNGDWYAANYDKRHDLTLVFAYELSKRWSVSANFTYSQGRPITVSDGLAVYEGIYYPTYTGRNNTRIPDYHRLDLGATLQGKHNDERRWKSSWVFSIYNVYARRNAFSVYYKPEERSDVQLSILGTFVPSATYNFEF